MWGGSGSTEFRDLAHKGNEQGGVSVCSAAQNWHRRLVLPRQAVGKQSSAQGVTAAACCYRAGRVG